METVSVSMDTGSLAAGEVGAAEGPPKMAQHPVSPASMTLRRRTHPILHPSAVRLRKRKTVEPHRRSQRRQVRWQLIGESVEPRRSPALLERRWKKKRKASGPPSLSSDRAAARRRIGPVEPCSSEQVPAAVQEWVAEESNPSPRRVWCTF